MTKKQGGKLNPKGAALIYSVDQILFGSLTKSASTTTLLSGRERMEPAIETEKKRKLAGGCVPEIVRLNAFSSRHLSSTAQERAQDQWTKYARLKNERHFQF